MRSIHGFTLVELAIVIVIVGLLVGGVLQGQELIRQANIRSQIRQLAEYDTAALVFKSKYNYLPGDVPTSVNSFGITDRSALGGNNRIEDFAGNVPNSHAYYEPRNFFFNLSELKLIKDYTYLAGGSSNYSVGIMFAEAKIGKGGVAAVGMPDGVYYFLGPTLRNDNTNRSTFSTNSPNPSMTPSDAYALDEKTDDGIPITGKIKAVLSNFVNEYTFNSCLGASNQVYNLTTDNLLCRLIIKSKVD